MLFLAISKLTLGEPSIRKHQTVCFVLFLAIRSEDSGFSWVEVELGEMINEFIFGIRYGEDAAQLTERRTGSPLREIRFSRFGKGFFSQTLLRCPDKSSPCATTYINICAHVNDPVVHVRVRWIMEPLKHPARTVVWVALLSCS